MSFKEWQTKALHEVSFVTDFSANGSFADLRENVEYLSQPDYAILVRLVDFSRNWNGDFVYIPKRSYDFLRKCQLDVGDVVIANIGANAGTLFRVPNLGKPSALGPNALVIKTNNFPSTSKEFLYYYFTSPLGQSQIQSIITGSAQPKFSKTDIRNLRIPFPPVETQRRIADILSALDEKIELNRQTNATLEAIAQSIFREWFVEFNISGEKPVMVNSELGMIPIGWKTGKLGDICLLTKGVSYRSDELQPSDTALVTLKSINRGGGFNFNGFKEYTGRFKPSQLLTEGDLVFAQTDITQNADIVGSPAIVENPYDYNNLVASLDIVCCKPINEMPSSEALYYFLKHQDFKEYCLSYTNGSTVLHLRTAEVPNYVLVIPDEKILKKFDAIVSPIRQEIICNNRQSQLLSSIRDSLLPKLISGKIDVDNVAVNTEKK